MDFQRQSCHGSDFKRLDDSRGGGEERLEERWNGHARKAAEKGRQSPLGRGGEGFAGGGINSPAVACVQLDQRSNTDNTTRRLLRDWTEASPAGN
jgi:hypothetical protein